MRDHVCSTPTLGVPAVAPSDLPMPPYRFQRDAVQSACDDGTGSTTQLATDILRKAQLLGCSASRAPRL